MNLASKNMRAFFVKTILVLSFFHSSAYAETDLDCSQETLEKECTSMKAVERRDCLQEQVNRLKACRSKAEALDREIEKELRSSAKRSGYAVEAEEGEDS